MSVTGKVEIVVELKASAAQLHEVFGCKTHIVASMGPEDVQSCDLVEGEWGKPGCIVCWEYFQDGSHQIVKEKMEIIDNENFTTNFKVLEGSLLEKYKCFCSTVKITPKEAGSLVHWTYEYEKLNEDVPDPSGKLQLAVDIAKAIDAYLLAKQAQA